MRFELTELRPSTVWSLYKMRDRIQLDPVYQRASDIWTLDKRQLLIDTILNDFDIPKLYLHKFYRPLKKGARAFDYAIIDGKQRLESMWAFIEGKLALAEDFEFFEEPKTQAGGMTYAELGKEYPDLKTQFDSFPLAVINIETDDLEMIEEMFSRLNEAVPLSAPEKRNAYGGPVPVAIRKLAEEPLFTQKLPFPNKRYRHYDLAVKFLLSEKSGKIVDTKKAYLDQFVRSYSAEKRTKVLAFTKKTQGTVRRMASLFTSKDALLRQVGMVTLYYHLFRIAEDQGWTAQITRRKLADFERLREENRKAAEDDLTAADYELLEFDRFAQSPNDSIAIRFRLYVLLKMAFKKKVSLDNL